MNFKAVAQAEGDNIVMSGVLMDCQRKVSKQGKPYARTKITDNTGQTRDVALFGGKNGLPPPTAIGQDCMFSLSCKPDNRTGDPSYSGFFNSVSVKQGQHKQIGGESTNDIIVMQCAFKGAIELACHDKIKVEEIMSNAFEFKADMIAGKILPLDPEQIRPQDDGEQDRPDDTGDDDIKF